MEEAASERVELANIAENEATTTSPGVRPDDLAPGRTVGKSRVLMLALAVLAFGVGVGMLIGAHCNYSSAAVEAAPAAPAPRPSRIAEQACVGYTAGDPCVTSSNLQECHRLLQEGCSSIIARESCPLQFTCADETSENIAAPSNAEIAAPSSSGKHRDTAYCNAAGEQPDPSGYVLDGSICGAEEYASYDWLSHYDSRIRDSECTAAQVPAPCTYKCQQGLLDASVVVSLTAYITV